MSEKTVYTLQYPLTIGSPDTAITISQLEIVPRLKGKHMRAMGDAATDMEQGLLLLACMSGMDEDIIDEMDAVDVKAAIDLIKKNLPSTLVP